MGLLERVEVMHTLDQLSNDQHATLISQIFSGDRRMSNQILACYFAGNNNKALLTKIKQTAKSMIQSQDPGKEPTSQTVMTDPHILSNIALYLPNHRIIRLELLCRRSFISLRKYPAIYDLGGFQIHSYLSHRTKLTTKLDVERLRNVRNLALDEVAIHQLSAYPLHPIFRKLEKLHFVGFLSGTIIPQVVSMCDTSTMKELYASGVCNKSMSLSMAKDLAKLILNCHNLEMLIVKNLMTFSSDVSFQNIWTVQEIQSKLVNLKTLHFKESVDNHIKRTLFKALAPQLQSFHFNPRGHSFNRLPSVTLSLSSLLTMRSGYRNLKELCWMRYDESELARSIKILLQSQIHNLERICLFYEGSSRDYDITDEKTQKNLISFFKRNWNHIAVVEFYGRFGHELISCLKRGLLQREGGGALSIELPNFDRNNGSENDMIDIVGIANMSTVDSFAVLRYGDINEKLFQNVPNCVTMSNCHGYVCCRSEDFTATSWMHQCDHCESSQFEDLL